MVNRSTMPGSDVADQMTTLVQSSPDSPPQHPYIDCVRGYALLMVVTCHLSLEFKQLPYPVARCVTLGWHGVQLFFLASAVTLLMSWHFRTAKTEPRRVTSFFLRRFFRIAPAYYAAALLYYFLGPPSVGADPVHLLTALSFTNGWSPMLLPTLPELWHVVPGGWSVTVEVTFYVLFPLFAAALTSLSRAVLVFVLCLVVGGVLNRIVYAMLMPHYPPIPLNEFFYLWFPDQMSVFALGGIVYFVERLFRRVLGEPQGYDAPPMAAIMARFMARYGNLCPTAAIIAFLVMGQGHAFPQWTGQRPPYVPMLILVSLCLAVFLLALAMARRSLYLNLFAASVGRVSFSGYLLHFAVIHFTVRQFPALLHVDATGVDAIVAFALNWLLVVGVTFLLSLLSYRIIELPMMNIGKKLARRNEMSTA